MRRWCARTTEERRDSHGLTESTGQERTPSTCLVPKERVTPGTPEKGSTGRPRVHFVCQKAVEILLLIPRKNPLYTKASLSSIPPRSHRFLSNREKRTGWTPGFRGLDHQSKSGLRTRWDWFFVSFEQISFSRSEPLHLVRTTKPRSRPEISGFWSEPRKPGPSLVFPGSEPPVRGC